jgi:hypothetical protein
MSGESPMTTLKEIQLDSYFRRVDAGELIFPKVTLKGKNDAKRNERSNRAAAAASFQPKRKKDHLYVGSGNSG